MYVVYTIYNVCMCICNVSSSRLVSSRLTEGPAKPAPVYRVSLIHNLCT